MPRRSTPRTIRAVRTQLENLGLQMPPKDKLTPEALGARQKIAKWWPMIEAANVKVDQDVHS